MGSRSRTILGIDINQYELRVVEARGSVAEPEILRAGAAPTPQGSIEGDRIRHPEAVAETLRGLLSRMNVTTRTGVIGIGALSSITRVLEVPRVPDSELRMVIDGELAHYQILREGTGAYDFARLREPEAAQTNPQVLLMAAEQRVIATLEEIADRAGIQLFSLEPVLLSMCRAAYPVVKTQGTLACLSVSYGRSEVAIVDRGQIRLYRRIDIGSDDLISGRRASPNRPGADANGGPTLLGSAEEEAPASSGLEPGVLVPQSASNLVTELQRSLDYYRREFPQAGAVSRVLVATHDPGLDRLHRWIAEALNMECDLVEPPLAPSVGRAIASQLEPPAGLRFLGAAGLAMHGLAGHPESLPRFDLGIRRVVAPSETLQRTRLAWAAVAAFLILAAGGVAGLILSRTAARLEHELANMRTELVGKQQIEQSKIQEIFAQRDQLKMLKGEGLSVPRIMDYLTASLDPGAGLSEVNLANDGAVALAGQASTTQAMLDTVFNLQKCRFLVNPALESFTTRQNGQRQYVEFRVSSRLVGRSAPNQAEGTTRS